MNKEFSARTADENSTKYDGLHVSPACIKPNVICRFLSAGGELIDFVGEPIYYKVNGIYGYLCLCGDKVVHFYSDADGSTYYDEPNEWSVLNPFIEHVTLNEKVLKACGFYYESPSYVSPIGDKYYFSLRNGFMPEDFKNTNFKGVYNLYELKSLYRSLYGVELEVDFNGI